MINKLMMVGILFLLMFVQQQVWCGNVDVNTGYEMALGRAATSEELAYWKAHALPDTQDEFNDIVMNYLLSQKGEKELRLTIHRAFMQVYGHGATAKEQEEWQARIKKSRIFYNDLVKQFIAYKMAILIPVTAENEEKKQTKEPEKLASANGDGRMFVFATGKDKALWYNISKGGWSGWKSLGGIVNGGPDACSPNPGEVIVFLRASDNTIDAIGYDNNNGASPYVGYGSKIGSDPSVVCRAGNKIDLFARGHNNTSLYHTYAEDGKWAFYYNVQNGYAIEDVSAAAANEPAPSKPSFLENLFGVGGKFTTPPEGYSLGGAALGGDIKGSPDGCAFGGEKRAVFARGKDDYIWWRYWDGSNWINWESLGGLRMFSDPSAISRGDGKIDLFARGENNQLYVRSYNNGKWTPWFSWGGILSSGPDATSWGGNRIDVFARGADGAVWHAFRDDAKPLGIAPQWENIGGAILGDPTGVGVRW